MEAEAATKKERRAKGKTHIGWWSLALAVLVGAVVLALIRRRALLRVRERYRRRGRAGDPFSRVYPLDRAAVHRFSAEARRLGGPVGLEALGADAFWSPIVQWYAVEAGAEVKRRLYCTAACLVIDAPVPAPWRPASEDAYLLQVRPWGVMLTNAPGDAEAFDRGAEVGATFALTLQLATRPHFLSASK
jgi:hypothetical protein